MRRSNTTLEAVLAKSAKANEKLKVELEHVLSTPGNSNDVKEIAKLRKEKEELSLALNTIGKQLQEQKDRLARMVDSDSNVFERFADEREMWQRKLQRVKDDMQELKAQEEQQRHEIVALQSELEVVSNKLQTKERASDTPSMDTQAIQNRLMQTYIDLKKALHDTKDSLRKSEYTFNLEKGQACLDMQVDGSTIAKVTPGGFAEKQGMREGMVLKYVNGKPFTSLTNVVQQLAKGDVALILQEATEDAVVRLEATEAMLGVTPSELALRNAYLKEQIAVLSQKLVAAQVQVVELKANAEALEKEEQQRFEEVQQTAERLAMMESEAEELRAQIMGKEQGEASEDGSRTRTWLRNLVKKKEQTFGSPANSNSGSFNKKPSSPVFSSPFRRSLNSEPPSASTSNVKEYVL
eukprot:TRINITY_DN749_c0_g1_i4.p2 TRINITY_DN749_c0_g1~~TRINITY_DN749_c0_g1_i4.p2  ORF type:complete len:409 (+),score=192.66 TRINITY_DN749_c0_g1_i4:974-2200(+)